MKIFSKGEKANVRELPDLTSEIISTVTKTNGAEYVAKTKQKENGYNWFIVNLGNGKTGYVREDVGVLEKPSHPFKNLIVQGSEVPNAKPSVDTSKVPFSGEMIKEYIPTIDRIVAPKGIKMLATVMAQKEGFYKGTRSYRYNNPGNIGNTDSGANKGFKTLFDGIQHQITFLTNIARGKAKNYPLGKEMTLKPFYSEEIERNKKTYQLEPYCPGFKFKYTGQLDQFIKIYATATRQNNTYLSMIRSYFKQNGYSISDKTTLLEILNFK